MTLYLTKDDILDMHDDALSAFGGSEGILHEDAIDACLARVQHQYGGVEKFPTTIAKAGALLHGLATRHCFVDGNKRVALAAAQTFLALNGMEIVATDEELVELTLEAAKGNTTAEDVGDWLKQHIAT